MPLHLPQPVLSSNSYLQCDPRLKASMATVRCDKPVRLAGSLVDWLQQPWVGPVCARQFVAWKTRSPGMAHAAAYMPLPVIMSATMAS